MDRAVEEAFTSELAPQKLSLISRFLFSLFPLRPPLEQCQLLRLLEVSGRLDRLDHQEMNQRVHETCARLQGHNVLVFHRCFLRETKLEDHRTRLPWSSHRTLLVKSDAPKTTAKLSLDRVRTVSEPPYKRQSWRLAARQCKARNVRT